MRLSHAGLTLLCAVVLLLLAASAVAALPPLPSTFYGTITLDRANVPAGTLVTAWVGAVKCAEGVVRLCQGMSVYVLHVQGDDNATPISEGGREGDAVTFCIGVAWANERGTWHAGRSQHLDLTALSLQTWLRLPLLFKGMGR